MSLRIDFEKNSNESIVDADDTYENCDSGKDINLSFPDPGHEIFEEDEDREIKVRLDKWLWAARFFKTRAVARAAVKAGKVFYNNMPVKPNHEIELNAIISICKKNYTKKIKILGLSTRRRSSEDATDLFVELEETYNQETTGINKNAKTRYLGIKTKQFGEFNEGAPKKIVRYLRRSVNKCQNSVIKIPENENSYA